MPTDPTTPASLGDLPTVGFDGGEPPRLPPTATGMADDGDDAPDIPGFEVQRPLSRGGMGVVYLARQLSLNRPVALKQFSSD
jgi:serine/threonine protein kinase